MNRDDAESLFRRALEPSWKLGTLHVDAAFEGTDVFVFEYGSREFLEDGDFAFLALDVPVAVVDKWTGAVTFVTRPDFSDLVEIESLVGA